MYFSMSTSSTSRGEVTAIADAVVCPICRSQLDGSACDSIACTGCGRRFQFDDGVLDLRVHFENTDTGWSAEHFDNVYRQEGGFLDGYGHAARSGIPAFAEDYRLARVKDAIAAEIVGNHHGRLLDIGCGNGWFALRLREDWRFEGPIAGVDIAPIRVRRFLSESQRRGVDAIIACAANAESLPFPSAHFDHVLLTEVLEHVSRPGQVLNEVFRVLRPGGCAYITTPSARACRFWRIVAEPWRRARRVIRPPRSTQENSVYDTPLSAKSLRCHIDDAGLTLKRMTKAVCLPHESYLQFIPSPVLRGIVAAAHILESAGPTLMFFGLHYIVIVRKPGVDCGDK